MSPTPLPTRVFLACGVTDMRKGFDGLAVLVQQVLAQAHLEESLDDLSVDEVFTRCLESRQVPEEQWPALLSAYSQVLRSLAEEDSLAE